jgi:phosphoesterase RecJ-like protein
MKPGKNKNQLIKEIKRAIENASSIGITSHLRPDGDAYGSVLGLGLALISAGKKVQMVFPHGVSHTFQYLPGSQLVLKAFESRCDCYISVDCADLKRTRGLPEGIQFNINIDHHVTNENFARINYVDPDSVATCAILTELLPRLGISISLDSATALLSGIITDSIGFRTSSTNQDALKHAIRLMETGADLYEIYNKSLISRSYAAAKYWGFALARMQKRDGIVWTSLTLDDRKISGYKLDDDADLTNLLSSIEESRISVLFVEHSTTKTKISWRSVPGVNVSVLAAEFGGGGHPAAAGAEIAGNLEEVQQKVLERTTSYLHALGKGASRGDH